MRHCVVSHVFKCQLFSKSVADGLTLYKPHVAGLHDCDPTVAFTRKVNDVFDLLNGRHPIEAIRLNSKRDRLKVSVKISW